MLNEITQADAWVGCESVCGFCTKRLKSSRVCGIYRHNMGMQVETDISTNHFFNLKSSKCLKNLLAIAVLFWQFPVCAVQRSHGISSHTKDALVCCCSRQRCFFGAFCSLIQVLLCELIKLETKPMSEITSLFSSDAFQGIVSFSGLVSFLHFFTVPGKTGSSN